jgi:hypothetical protein
MKPINQWTTADILDLVKSVDKKTWIKIGIGAAIALVVIYLIVWPAWFERPAIKNKNKALENQIMQTNALFKRKPELEKSKGEYAKIIEGAKSRLYQPGESSLLLGVISKMAQEANVSIIASRPKPFEGTFPAPFNTLYEASSYDFTVEGKYHDMGRFISSIESNAKLLRIEKFLLKPQEKSPDKHLGELSLTAVSYKKANA